MEHVKYKASLEDWNLDAIDKIGKALEGIVLKAAAEALQYIFEGDETAINSLLNLLRDEQQGLPFVKDQFVSNLPEYSFVAIEAIWWAVEHCEDIKNEEQALELFQVNKA